MASLVGRRREVAVLTRAVDDPGAAIVRGPAGIGKSALLGEVSRAVGARSTVERVVGSHAGAATTLAPFLAMRPPGPVTTHTPEELLQQILEAIERKHGDQRLVLVVDDAHLLDDLSVLVVHQLLHHGRARALIAGRDSEPLAPDLLNLVTTGLAVLLELGPLSEESSSALAEMVLGGPTDIELRRELWRRSQGNPLFLRELATEGRERGWVEQRDGRWSAAGPLPTPAQVLLTIGDRLERHTTAAVAVRAVARAGGPVRLALLEKVVPLDAIIAAEEVGLLHEVAGGGPGASVDVAHPLYAEAAVAIASAGELRAVDQALLAALRQAHRRNEAEELLAGRLVLELDEPDAEELVRAAAVAMDVFDHRFALACADGAVRLGGGIPAARARANALAATGPADEADAAYTDLLAEDLDAATRDLVAADYARFLLHGKASPARATAVLRQELAHLPEDRSLEVRALLAHTLFFAGQLHDAAEVAAPALRSADGPASVVVGPGYASAQAVLGRPDAALAVIEKGFEEIRRGWRRPESMFQVVSNFLWIQSLCLWQLGRAGELDGIIGPDGPLAGTGAQPVLDHPIVRLAMPASFSLVRGHLDRAVEGHVAVRPMLGPAGFQVLAANLELTALAHTFRGDVDSARADLARLESIPDDARPGVRWWARRPEALLRAAAGQLEEATERCLELADDHAVEGFHATTSRHDVVRLGRPDLVLEVLHEEAGAPDATWWQRSCAAHARAAVDDDVAALLRVATRFESGGLDHYAAEAAAQAVRAASTAADLASATGRLESLLSRCGSLRTPAVLGLPDDPLTPRERQVATMAAGGLTNSQIAAALDVSPRTVGNQLHRAYGKLGISSRSELAAVLGPLGGHPTRQPPPRASPGA